MDWWQVALGCSLAYLALAGIFVSRIGDSERRTNLAITFVLLPIAALLILATVVGLMVFLFARGAD